MQPPNGLEEKTGITKIASVQKEHSISPAAINRIIIGIILLIVIVEIGFFKTYIRHFPQFKDYYVTNGNYTMHFNWIMHFHGMVMMGWILMLLLQPILILKGKIKLHRLVGKLSYVLAPLVMLAFYLANRDNYFSIVAEAGQQVGISVLAVTFPTIFFFAILYPLAIIYRHRPELHMRFMCSTAFLFIDPALSRALANWTDWPAFPTSMIIILILVGIVTLVDSLRTKRISPFTLVFFLLLFHKILMDLGDTPFWQAIGNKIVKIF